jgi:hypothetical protein
MQGDIINVEIGLTGIYKDVAGLTGAVSNLETCCASVNSDILGLTGAVRDLETGLTGVKSDIAGITGAVSNLETCCASVNSDILGLTGAVDSLTTYVYSIQAVNVGFSPVTGAGSTNVQGAIEALVNYVDVGLSGVNYGSGVTGQQGETGFGIQGATGAGAGGISHSMLTGMPDVLGVVVDHDIRLVTKVQNDPPTIPTPFTGMLWLDLDAPDSLGITGPIGETGFGVQGDTGLMGVTGLESGSNSLFDTLPIVSNEITLDLSSFEYFEVVLTDNVSTVTITNVVSGKVNYFSLMVEQDGVGGRTFTTPGTWVYPGGVPYTVSSGIGAIDTLRGVSYDDGTTWLVTFNKGYS